MFASSADPTLVQHNLNSDLALPCLSWCLFCMFLSVNL